MEKIVRSISSVLGIAATIATLVMMIAIAIDVVYRLFYDKSVPGVLEVSETALVTAVFLGLAYTGVTNSHIAVDLLTERLPAKAAQWVIATAWIATTVFLAWMLIAVTSRAMDSTAEGEQRFGLVAWPIWPSRWVIAVGVAAMLLVAIVNVIRTLSGKEVMGVDDPERVLESPQHPYEYVTGRSDEGVDAAQLANDPVSPGEDRKAVR